MATPSGLYRQDLEHGLIKSDPAQLEALTHLDTLHLSISDMLSTPWYRRWQRPQAPPGLYLWGGVGTGKTLVMDFFHRALPDGVAWRIHFHRFMQWVHDRRRAHGDQQNPLDLIAVDLSARHRVLCLDEFAVTDITDAMILYGLLKSLFAEHVVLVTTSNIPPNQLYLGGLQRDRFLPAIDLLRENTREVHVDSGNDYRMAYLQQDSIYHYPLGPETDAEISAAFGHLAGAHRRHTDSVEIAGREIPVVATGSGVVWFEFAELCEGNRSKVDYIEIARQFHTVFLTNVTTMDDNSNDPARRLMELVDELYDRGVNLIISAAALPEKLYAGKRLADPFRRTVSRLHEMSSADYLARPHLS